MKFYEKYKNYNEAFNSNDEEEIKLALESIMNFEEPNFFAKDLVKINFCDAAYSGEVPPIPTKSKMSINFLKTKIKSTKSKLMNFILSRFPYWNEVVTSNSDEHDKIAQIINSVLISEIYNDTNDPTQILNNLFDIFLKYGDSKIYEKWEFVEEKIKTHFKSAKDYKKGVTEESIKKGVEEEGKSIDDFVEFETKTKKIIKIIKDNLKIEVLNNKNLRVDSRATNFSEIKYCYIHRYPDFEDLVTDFGKTQLIDLNIKNDKEKNGLEGANSKNENNDDIKKRFNNHIIEFWGYKKRIYALCEPNYMSYEDGISYKLQKILIPLSRKDDIDKFENPYNHKQIPISNFICSIKPYTWHGESLITENYDNYLLLLLYLNKFIDSIEEESTQKFLINTDNEVNTNELFGLLYGTGRYARASGDISKALFPIQSTNSSQINHQAFTMMYNQLQSNMSITDFSKEGGQYAATLGGIREIQNEAEKMALEMIIINIMSFKSHINRCISLILQYAKKERVQKITGESGHEWVKIKRKCSTSIFSLDDIIPEPENEEEEERQQNELKNKYSDETLKNKELKEFYIDEISKINLVFDINFLIENPRERLAKIKEAMNTGIELLKLAIPVDIMKLSIMYFNELGIKNIMADSKRDEEKAKKDISYFEEQYKNGLTLLTAGKIEYEEFIRQMKLALPEPDERYIQNPVIYIQMFRNYQKTLGYPETLENHILIYESIYNRIQQVQKDRNARLKAEESGKGSITAGSGLDGRTIVKNSNRNQENTGELQAKNE